MREYHKPAENVNDSGAGAVGQFENKLSDKYQGMFFGR